MPLQWVTVHRKPGMHRSWVESQVLIDVKTKHKKLSINKQPKLTADIRNELYNLAIRYGDINIIAENSRYEPLHIHKWMERNPNFAKKLNKYIADYVDNMPNTLKTAVMRNAEMVGTEIVAKRTLRIHPNKAKDKWEYPELVKDLGPNIVKAAQLLVGGNDDNSGEAFDKLMGN